MKVIADLNPVLICSLIFGMEILLAQPQAGRAMERTEKVYPTLIVTPSTGIQFSGFQGGSFIPLSVEYHLRASTGKVRYSINKPAWLTADSSFGEVDGVGLTITFKINNQAYHLPSGTYGPAISFTNVTNGRGSGIRRATLIVKSKSLAPVHRSAPVDKPNDSREDALLDSRQGLLKDALGGRLLAR